MFKFFLVFIFISSVFFTPTYSCEKCIKTIAKWADTHNDMLKFLDEDGPGDEAAFYSYYEGLRDAENDVVKLLQSKH